MNKTLKIILSVIGAAVLFLGGYGLATMVHPDTAFAGISNLSGLNVMATQDNDSFSIGTTTGTQLIASGGRGQLYAGGGFSEGGGIYATSTAASATMRNTEISPYNLISVALTVGSATITLPATSTLSAASTTVFQQPNSVFLPNAGDSQTVFFYNSTTTVGQLLTLAFGTGWKGSIATSSAATTVILNPGKGASLEIVRLANGDLMGLFTPGI